MSGDVISSFLRAGFAVNNRPGPGKLPRLITVSDSRDGTGRDCFDTFVGKTLKTGRDGKISTKMVVETGRDGAVSANGTGR